MEYISFEELRQRMNTLGRAGRPYVWATDYDRGRCFLMENPMQTHDVLWEVNGVGNMPTETAHDREAEPPRLRIVRPVGEEEYAEMFGIIHSGLMRGDSFLANLTAPTEIELTASLREVFLSSKAPFKLLIGEEFVCFSPEPFVKIQSDRISTYPMKGTIDASLPDAEQTLMNDYKETCEHYTIVDLLRNDLNIVSEDVEVGRLRYVERISTASRDILQTSSEICGRIPEERQGDFGDLILPLLPAGSITGAPKAATVDLIGRAERSPRGWYTGVFGYFDGSEMQSAVMIRCIQRGADGRLYFHSGGGVTVNSNCREEYEELLAKVYLTK